MSSRRTTARDRRPLLIGLACSLCVLDGCTTYDASLLRFAPEVDAAIPKTQTPPRTDARASEALDAAAVDVERDARASDAMLEDSGDADAATLDGEAASDAGCASGANPNGGDCCPNDTDKTAPGTCGCGVPDTDSDGDEAADCIDECPDDAAKNEPGDCGCGLLEADAPSGAASCVGIRSALVHRYRFDAMGTSARDSIGSAHGTVVNAQIEQCGVLALAGGTTDQYVDLPNDILATMTNVTVEAWITWDGGAPWQRVFDFGDAMSGGEGAQGDGRSSLFFTPATAEGGMRATFKDLDGNETSINAGVLPTNTRKHIAVVVDDAHDLFVLYVDGALVLSTALTDSLASINSINNWIGRSQFAVDAELSATLHEFRIYNAALGAAQLATSFAAGPDPAFLRP